MEYDINIGFCDYDWYVDPGVIWLIWGIGVPGEYAIYEPLTFPPPCTAGHWTGIIGVN